MRKTSVNAGKTRPETTVEVSIRRRVYLHLHQQIRSGTLSAGDSVSELQVSKAMGVSRSPVREAMGLLVADGLIEQTPNRGAVVVELRRDDIVDLYEVREALEVFAVRKAAERGVATPDVEQMRSLLEKFGKILDAAQRKRQRNLTEKQQAEFTQLDLRLHALLVLSTRNLRMQKIVNETRVLVQAFSVRRGGHDLVALERIQKEHEAIVTAVERRDADKAERLVSRHIKNSLAERLEDFDHGMREAAIGRLLGEPERLTRLSR